ncbi:MAG: M6 family metalloprotease domain-containing protein [Bacteroidaceae bacterium]|nr:M6 family metalloprotease domain-containing protein [Bacteroidaceae bacterium]
MKKFLMSMAFLAMTQMAAAIPAKRVVRQAVQPDGTTVEVVLCGDETFHFYTTPDGSPIRRGADGFWVADTRDVGSEWSRRAQRRAAQRAPHAGKMRRMMAALARDTRSRRAKAAAGGAGGEEPTAKKGLLILVNFKDKKLVTPAASIHAVYDQMLNSLGNPYGSNHGSIREYFRDQSYGQMDVTFDIKGPVTLANNMKYYGQDVDDYGNPSTAAGDEGNDARPGDMVKEALKAIQTEVNFSDYDWDGDGEVENVYVIYAGYGQASGAAANTIWPHQWQLSQATGSAFRYGGVVVDTYACGPELLGVSGSTLDGIGTMCHEYSHCLGLPDFYDTEGKNFGMSTWSIMDYGCYNGDGFCPAGYTAYERMYSGWLEPTQLTTAATVAGMNPIETHPEAYIIYNDANHNEYYLLENHQLTGWDEEAYGHGMLVVHVDYDATAWAANTVNNTASRQRMTIIPADGKQTDLTAATMSAYNAWMRSLAGDPYPGTSANTSLTDTSSPAASLYRSNTDGQKLMHKPVTDIAEDGDGLVSFTFMGGIASVATPTADDVNIDIHSDRFTAAWLPVEGAASYNLQYRTVTTDGADDVPDMSAMQQAVRVDETFANFYADSDGSLDISLQLDDYTTSPGWTGTRVYKGENGAKVGAAKAQGYLVTPSFSCGSGSLTLVVGLSHWYNANGIADDATVDVVVQSATGEELSKQSLEPEDDYLVTLRFGSVPASARIYLGAASATKQRFYADFCLVLDGDYTDEEIDSYVQTLYYAPRRKPMANVRRNATTYGPWQEVTGITATSYFLSNLELNALYQYRVQAVDADGNTSAWSAPKLVQLAGTVGIARVEGAATDAHTPRPGASAPVCYDLAGRRVADASRRGIYIIDGKKVVR